MEAILVALITGGLSLLGVVITNMMAARRAEQRMVTAQAVTDCLLYTSGTDCSGGLSA